MKKMIVAVLMAFAIIPAEAQTTEPPTAPKAGLPVGALLMLPVQRPKPHYRCLSPAPRDFPAPLGWEPWKVDPSPKCLVDLDIGEILDPLFRCDKKWSPGKIRDGKICVCKDFNLCSWENLPKKSN